MASSPTSNPQRGGQTYRRRYRRKQQSFAQPPSVVYLAGVSPNVPNAGTIPVPIIAPTYQGATIVVNIGAGSSVTVASVSDTQGNNYYPVQSVTNGSGNSVFQWISYASNPLSPLAGDSISVRLSGAGSGSNAYALACPASGVAQFSTSSGTSGAPSDSVTTTVANEIAIAILISGNAGGVPAWVGPWAPQGSLVQSGTAYTSLAWQYASQIGTETAAAAVTSTNWAIALLTLSSLYLPGESALSGSGSLTATGYFAGTSTLSGSGSITASDYFAGFSALSGTGSITEAVTLGYSTGLSGSGSISASGYFAGFSSLSGSGSIAEGVTLGASTSLSGSGSITAAGYFAGFAGLSGSGSISAGVTLGYSAALSGSGSVTATGYFAGSSSLSGSGSITESVILGYSAALSGTGSIISAGYFVGFSALSGSGSVSESIVLGYSGALSGSGSITAAGYFAGSSSLSGSGSLIGAGVLSGSGTPYAIVSSAETVSSGSSYQTTITGSTSAGDGIVVCVLNNDTAVSGVTDSQGNVYILAESEAPAGMKVYVFVASYGSGGVGTPTVKLVSGTDWIQANYATIGASSEVAIIARGCTGVVNSSPVDSNGTAAATNTSSSPAVTGTSTLAQASEWIVAALGHANSTSASSGWSDAFTVEQVLHNSGEPFFEVADEVVSSTATQTASCSITSSGKWSLVQVALELAGPASQGTAALSGSGSLTASGYFAGASSLSGSGSLASSVTLGYSVALSGSGSLTSVGYLAGSSNLIGSGSISEAVVLSFSSALSGSGSITAAGYFAASSSLSGSGSITTSVILGYTSALSGSGSITASAYFAGSVTLSGTGSINESVILGFSSALSGSGALSATGSISGQEPGSAALSGSGFISEEVTLGPSVGLSGSGSISASFYFAPTAALSGTGSITAAVAFAAAASLSGSGTLTSSASFTPIAILSGSGSLSVTALEGHYAILAGSGTLTASYSLAVLPVSILSGTGSLAGTVSVTIGTSLVGADFVATLQSVSWEAKLVLTCGWNLSVEVGWKSLLAQSEIYATSLVNVPVNITPPLGIAPTSYGVQFAFLSTDPPEPQPTSGQYVTGSWSSAYTAPPYQALCLVGPGGAETLAAGTWNVWVKINATGSGEEPVLYAGVLYVL